MSVNMLMVKSNIVVISLVFSLNLWLCNLSLLEKENVCGDTGCYTAWETLYFPNYLFIYLFYMIIMIIVQCAVQTAMD